jgi:hypothetical protein
LRAHLRDLTRALSARPGASAGHLLQNQTPQLETTTEQKIRGGPDPAADWIFILCGYDRAALESLARDELADGALSRAGAQAGAVRGLYALSHSNTATDVA